jgi:hypothetical protein
MSGKGVGIPLSNPSDNPLNSRRFYSPINGEKTKRKINAIADLKNLQRAGRISVCLPFPND